jgi:hypothetical protein
MNDIFKKITSVIFYSIYKDTDNKPMSLTLLPVDIQTLIWKYVFDASLKEIRKSEKEYWTGTFHIDLEANIMRMAMCVYLIG